MNTFAISSSTNAISMAYVKESTLVGEFFINSSRTLAERMPTLISDFFSTLEIPLSEIGGIAVVTGPGAFTNLRVGITAAKLVAQQLSIPITGLDGLDVVAKGYPTNGTIVVVQKARRDEVNAAVFACDGYLTRRQSDNFISTYTKLSEKLSDNAGPLFLTGDGAPQVHEILLSKGNSNVVLAPPQVLEPKASVTAFAGQEKLVKGESSNVITLGPVYSHPPNIKKTTYGKNPNITT